MRLKLTKNKRFLFYVVLAIALFSCSSEDSSIVPADHTLAANLVNREFRIDNVIACAGSTKDQSLTSIFLYPRDGVTNINYYHTNSLDVDKNDYSNYILGEGALLDVFNGFLLKYEIAPIAEQWVIVAFEENGVVNISNPIRIKHISKPTEYLSDNVNVDATGTMPIFEWQDGQFNDTAIYFHVVSDNSNSLLSGTYTFEKNFQYYKLDNVVLNVTQETPPILTSGASYNFTLLGVSEDNWINLFSELSFQID